MELSTALTASGNSPCNPGRVLMKDGRWIVPPLERPKGWERMGIAEQSNQNPAATVMHDDLERVTETTETSLAVPLPVVDATAGPPPCKRNALVEIPALEPAGQFDPFALIPEDPPEAKELVDSTVRFWADPTVSDFESEQLSERCSILADKIWNHRNARRRVVEILTPWFETDWDGTDPVGESYKQLCLILHRELLTLQEALNEQRLKIRELTSRVEYLQQELKAAEADAKEKL